MKFYKGKLIKSFLLSSSEFHVSMFLSVIGLNSCIILDYVFCELPQSNGTNEKISFLPIQNCFAYAGLFAFLFLMLDALKSLFYSDSDSLNYIIVS